MPGSNLRALEKAKQLPADCIIFDLEDAVAPDAKVTARKQICEAVRSGAYGDRELIVRINGLDTQWGVDDMRDAAEANPHVILVPKVNCALDVERASHMLDAVDSDGNIGLWAMMEEPLGILNAREIAATSETTRLSGWVMGTNDLAMETGALVTAGRMAMVSWLSICVAAARAYGLVILDGVFNDIGDGKGFRRECEQGRTLGFDGKTLIHPRQIEPANEVFAPLPEEVSFARAVVDAFDLPENANKGAIRVDGRMVELLHVEMAKKTVAVAEAIAERKSLSVEAR